MNVATCILFGTILGVSNCKYISMNPKLSKTNHCENASNTAPVEHFFNIIFSEFHNMPPACVCIQMCPEQPTYCYPNGCLKRSERRNVDETTYIMNAHNRAHQETTTKSVMFVADSNKDLMDDLLEGPGLNSYIDKTEKSQIKDLTYQPSPFREMVLKYRKPPKLEMTYNLREQVKNTKSDKFNRDKIDISKTRWPVNKHLLHGKQPFNRIRHYKKNENVRQTKFFTSMFPEYAPANYSPIFYKKYITKRENNDAVNVEALYLYQTDIANFSFETLIDNLIENSLDKSKKNARVNLNVNVDDINDREPIIETTTNFRDTSFLYEEEKLTTTDGIKNTDINVFSINSSNENSDVNKYLHDSINTTDKKTFLEMIAGMSNEIEKQNKVNSEFISRVAGINTMALNNLIFNTTDNKLQKVFTVANFSVTDNAPVTNKSQNITVKSQFSGDFNTTRMPVTRASFYKKSKQRIVRKLKHRKLK